MERGSRRIKGEESERYGRSKGIERMDRIRTL